MAKPINMPKLSDEMTEGKLAEWLKNVGDEVKAGEVVAQVETEKATLDIEAFEGGVLLGIVVQKGDTAPVGQPIAWIGAKGEKVPESAPQPSSDATKETRVGGEVAHQSTQPLTKEQHDAEQRTAERAPPPRPTAAPGGSPESARGATSPTPAAPPQGRREAVERRDGRIIASPAARKAARERGIDLAALSGSGPAGRVVLADLERAARAPAAPAPAARPHRRTRELPPRKALRAESVPLSPMRKAIARNLSVAKPGAPHFYLEMSADMRRAVALREQLNELGRGDVSLNDVIVKAAAEALVRHPDVNSSWSDEAIVRHGEVHVGIAVAIEDGLITPVVRHADRLTIFEVAQQAKELARRARDRRLKPDEYRGGTFTVTNLGMFGIDAFYGIINPPEAGILSVGTVEKVPWVDEESGELVVVQRCRFGLSGDHRVIDGASGARFLQTFKAVIESPVRLLVESPPSGSGS